MRADKWSLLLLYLHVQVENWVKSTRFCQIQHNLMCCEYLHKTRQKYLTALICKYHSFTGQNSETFDISHAYSH